MLSYLFFRGCWLFYGYLQIGNLYLGWVCCWWVGGCLGWFCSMRGIFFLILGNDRWGWGVFLRLFFGFWLVWGLILGCCLFEIWCDDSIGVGWFVLRVFCIWGLWFLFFGDVCWGWFDIVGWWFWFLIGWRVGRVVCFLRCCRWELFGVECGFGKNLGFGNWLRCEWGICYGDICYYWWVGCLGGLGVVVGGGWGLVFRYFLGDFGLVFGCLSGWLVLWEGWVFVVVIFGSFFCFCCCFCFCWVCRGWISFFWVIVVGCFCFVGDRSGVGCCFAVGWICGCWFWCCKNWGWYYVCCWWVVVVG